MLVLTRKISEVIYVGDDIAITVVSIDCGKVRLGIVAPRAVRVLRSELLLPDPPPLTPAPDPVPCPPA